MRKYFILTLCIIGWFFSGSAQAQATTQQLTKDLQYLAEKLPKKHASFETFTTRAKFQQNVEALAKKIPQLNQTQFRLELMKLVASLNDQSTTLPLGDQLHAFPLGTYWFADGLHIVSASPKYTQYKGYQITHINQTPIEQVWEKVRPYLSAENDYARKQRFFVTRGLLAELLHYTGVISQPNEAQFTLKAPNGKTEKVTVKAVGIKSFLQSVVYDQVAPTTMPANTHRQKKNYWFKYLGTGIK